MVKSCAGTTQESRSKHSRIKNVGFNAVATSKTRIKLGGGYNEKCGIVNDFCRTVFYPKDFSTRQEVDIECSEHDRKSRSRRIPRQDPAKTMSYRPSAPLASALSWAGEIEIGYRFGLPHQRQSLSRKVWLQHRSVPVTDNLHFRNMGDRYIFPSAQRRTNRKLGRASVKLRRSDLPVEVGVVVAKVRPWEV